MRVVHIVRQFAPSVGGLEDVVLNLARHQRRADGIDARVVTLDRLFTRPAERLPARDEVDGVPVRRLRWWGSKRYPIAPGVLRHLRDADLVHVHAIDFFVDFLALTRFLHRKPLVVLTHGGIFHTPKAAALKRLWFNTVTRLSLRAVDVVVAGSENDRALFAPLRPPRLETIESGAALAKLRAPASAGRTAFPRRMLYLGRFAPHKRIGALFALLAALRRHQADWDLVVAGIEAGESLAALRNQAAAAGVAGAVRFVLGAGNAELAAEAAEASWFGCASAFEGFGVAAVEAAGAGLVPVLSRIPTFERLARSLPDAVLFDPAAPEDACRDMLALAARWDGRFGELRDALAAAAEHHDWPHVAARYVELYRSVLQPGGTSAERRREVRA